ncbi:hypothetical protein [Streptomyces pseudogriseolus]|uniref:hypothetical protein n=1 Tax=Streptomyces pseudogriseolus TaxID=36817 RepID=UPI003FA2C233
MAENFIRPADLCPAGASTSVREAWDRLSVDLDTLTGGLLTLGVLPAALVLAEAATARADLVSIPQTGFRSGHTV